MSKAREIVLKLVADGKISVEEAEELLDAIEGGEEEPFSGFFHSGTVVEPSPRSGKSERAHAAHAEARERVREAKARAKQAAKGKAGTGYKGGFEFNFPWDQPDWQWPWEAEGWQWPWEQEGWPGGQAEDEEEEAACVLEVPADARLITSTVGGHLVIQGNGQEASLRLVVPGAPNKVMVEDGIVRVVSAGEDVVLEVPQNVASMEIAHNGGDVTIGKLEAGLVVKVAGGDMVASEVSGNIQVAVEGGDVRLTGIRSAAMEVQANGGDAHLSMLSPVEEGSIILSSSDDISLVLPADSRCEISATAGGDLSCDLPEETEIIEKSDNFLNAKLNGGGAEFTLSARSGDINIKT